MNKNPRKQLRWQLPLLLLLIAGTIFIVRQQQALPYQKNTGLIFGTIYNITYQYDQDLQMEIETALDSLDATFSMFNENSIVAKLNRNEQPALTPTFIMIFKDAQKVSEDTNGAFDITVGPLVNAWGFGFKHEQMPTPAKVDSLRKYVGMQLIGLNADETQVEKKYPGVVLDFSAIAKGYSCDVVAKLFESKGIENYMVEIGGEVNTKGVNPNGHPWRIGVTKPTEGSHSLNEELQTVLNVTDRAMATSGNYRNYYYKDGRKLAHTIDPRTGYPVQHNLLSATVLADDCATADAYATSFMVLGLDETKALLARHPDLMAYLIYTDDEGRIAVWYSPNLEKKINP